MKKQIIIMALMILISSSIASAFYCYQESANTTNQTGIDGNCILSYNGTYAFLGLYYTYFNFTTPKNDSINLFNVSRNLLRFKSNQFGDTNFSIPTSCVNRPIAQFRIYSWTTYEQLWAECYTGSTWINITSIFNTTNNDNFVSGGIKPYNFYDGNWSSGYASESLYQYSEVYWPSTTIYGVAMNWNYYQNNIYNILAINNTGSCDSGYSLNKIFIYRDEDNITSPINVSSEMNLIYWYNNINDNKTLNYVSNGYTNNFSLCVNSTGNSLNLTGNIYLKFSVNNGITNRYYAFNTYFDNSSNIIYLYNYPNTTSNVGQYTTYGTNNSLTSYINQLSELRLIVRNIITYDYYSDVIVSLQRYYVSDGTWRTVQMSRTGNYGLADFWIRQSSTDYRLIYQDIYNDLLKQTTSMRFSCDNYICSINDFLSSYTPSVNATNLVGSASYINNSGFITFTWNSNAISTVTTSFTKITAITNIPICNVTQTATTGYYACNVSGLTGDIIVNSMDSNNNVFYNKIISLNGNLIGIYIGNSEGAYWSAGIIITIVLASIFSPVAAVIATILGLIVVSLLGLYSAITVTFIAVAGVIAILIGLKVKR